MTIVNPTHEQIAETRPILYLDGVTVSFDGFKALNGLSLYIEPGEMRAIIVRQCRTRQTRAFAFRAKRA